MARSGRGWPLSPPPTSGGLGPAVGRPRASESGRVFPPPLGQARERCRTNWRSSLANPASAPARPRFSGACRLAAPAWFAVSAGDGALEGGFKSAQGSCSARGVRSGAGMVSGARSGLGPDSGGGAGRRGLANPATLAKPEPYAGRGSRLRSERGWQGAVCAQVPLASRYRSTEVRVRGPSASRDALLGGRAAGYAANALFLEQLPGPLHHRWGGAGALGAGV